MKKIIIIIGIIFALFLINLFSINAFYNNFSGKKLYENKDFSGALNYFEKNKDYIGLYNLGNLNYKLGENQKEDIKKISYWEKSLDYYKNSLKIRYTKDAEFNYNFVKDKLDKLKKKLEEQKKQQREEQNKNQENKSEDSKGGSGKDKHEEQKGDNKNDGKSGGDNKKNGQDNSKNTDGGDKKNNGESQKEDKENGNKDSQSKNGKTGDSKEGNQENNGEKKGQEANNNPGKNGEQNSGPRLTEAAKQQLKAYEEQLKQQQQQNASSYGKVYREQSNPFDSFDSFFRNDPFFDNSLLNSGSDKKDW